MDLFVCLTLTPAQIARIEAAAAARLHIHPEPEADPAARSDFDACEIAFGNPPSQWLAESPALRWVQLESVGFGEYAGLGRAALGSRVRMTNLAGFFSEPVAESILAGVLAHYRGIARLALLQEREDWQGDGLRPSLRTLAGARIVLFGGGDINRRVAELLSPFGCAIAGFKRDYAPDALEGELGEADVVICTVPDTPSTRGLFDRRLLGRIKPGALFLNFGRGSLVDEAALVEALDSGRLAGAVIDVTREEPLPPDHRFWRCRNLLLTQHTAGGTMDEVDRKIDYFLANLDRYKRHEPLQGRVDFSRGY